MQVAKLLDSIKTSAHLTAEEYQEVVESYYEIVNLKLVKLLGRSLTNEQQNRFTTDLKNIQDGTPLGQITQMLAGTSVTPDVARNFIDLSVRQAFEEIIAILEFRIPQAAKDNLLTILK